VIGVGHLIGHRDWAPTRKIDPGPRLVDYIRDYAPGGGAPEEPDDMTPEQEKRITDALQVIRGKVEATYNVAASADAQARAALLEARNVDYDVIRADGTPQVWLVAGDSRVHIPNQTALAAFGGPAAVKVVRPDDPRMLLPVLRDTTPDTEQPPVPPTGG
jgi:hypothetical protein